MVRSQRPPTRMFSSRESMQLLTMATMFVVIIVCIARLRRPGSMDWFFADAPNAAIQTTLPTVNDAPIAGTSAKLENAQDAKSSTPTQENQSQVPNPVAQIASPVALHNPLNLKQTEDCTEVESAILRPIRDKTRREAPDRDAILHLLCVAATQSPEILAAKSQLGVLFTNLFNEPARFRGKPVHLHGLLRRVVRWEIDAKTNPHGIKAYYETWIFPDDQRFNPCLVLCSQLPMGIGPGDNLIDRVEIDAYFLKLSVYQSEDGKQRVAPLLVGAALRRQPPVPTGSGKLGLAEWTFIGVAALGMITFGILWRRIADRSAVRDNYVSQRNAIAEPGDPFALTENPAAIKPADFVNKIPKEP